MTVLAPTHTTRAAQAMVATVDTLATQAGLAMLHRGGSAADAAIAANAVLAVTLPSQCGLGGDLFALVHAGREVEALIAAGRAGSGADAERLRDEGHAAMPAENDVRSTTVPGCVDGWLALHRRHGRLPFAELLEPAIRYASEGFPASRYFAEAVTRRAPRSSEAAALLSDGVLREGQRVVRPGIAHVLRALAHDGRAGVFEGAFGDGLLELGQGYYVPDDLAVDQAEWTAPLSLELWGARVWTPPAPSQGYLALAAGRMAEHLGLPDDPDDPAWAHLLIEAIRQSAHDRPRVLFDGAELDARLTPELLARTASLIDLTRTQDTGDEYRVGGTTYLCVVDADGMAVSLMQSNCMAFGSGLAIGDTGVWLHNRGIGFSLEPGHPGEYGPGRRPAHTLTPALVTTPDGAFRAALGTRGGDSQPQVVLQLLARLLSAGQQPGEALAAGRWILRGAEDSTSFNTWGFHGRVRVAVEGQAPDAWTTGLRSRGHVVEPEPAFAHPFGHAQLIVADGTMLAGAADPRATAESAAGY